MSVSETSSSGFFEAKYREAPDADPWQFGRSPYEAQRYGTVMRALAGRRCGCAFEPGCSVGVLTAQLAVLCDQVEACDFSPTAVAKAQARCAALPNVRVRCAALTGHEPWQQFDLVVLSEIGYYFEVDAWRALVDRMAHALRSGAVVLASHWLGHSPDHVQHGDAVHAAMAHSLLRPELGERHEGFRLDRWVRA